MIGLDFQSRVHDWMLACFGEEIAADEIERNHRFLEESLELVQSLGCSKSEAHQLVDYVYSRTSGDPNQECGGVMVTLAALCNARRMSSSSNGDKELARVWDKIHQIREKQAAKPKHSPLSLHWSNPGTGLVNELEREIIRLNRELHDPFVGAIPTLKMYVGAWMREIGGYINRKSHQIDGFVLRTRDALAEARQEGRKEALDAYQKSLDVPVLEDFLKGAVIEAQHQRKRHGDQHDTSKTPEQWYWVIGYLAGKGMRAQIDGDMEKFKHHLITARLCLRIGTRERWKRKKMGELTRWERFIEWIGECSHRVFLWSKGWTEEQFIGLMLQAEMERRAVKSLDKIFPRPCGLCPGMIESEEDYEWHGLGNCVPICERCGGSGQEPEAKK